MFSFIPKRYRLDEVVYHSENGEDIIAGRVIERLGDRFRIMDYAIIQRDGKVRQYSGISVLHTNELCGDTDTAFKKLCYVE